VILPARAWLSRTLLNLYLNSRAVLRVAESHRLARLAVRSGITLDRSEHGVVP
jgi:hypothetical protein